MLKNDTLINGTPCVGSIALQKLSLLPSGFHCPVQCEPVAFHYPIQCEQA